MEFSSIEMIGLSGVGKTTLFYNMEDNLFEKMDEYYTVHPVKPHKLIFFFETLKLIIRFIFSFGFFKSLCVLRSKKNISLFIKLGYRISGIKDRNLSGLVYLRDSGVLMPLLSSVIDDRIKIDNTMLFKILINIPLPKYVYCVVDSPDNIYDRFISRERKLGNDVKGYTISDFKNANTFLFRLINLLKDVNVNVTVISKIGVINHD